MAPERVSTEAFVGGDLHSLVADPQRPGQLYVGGHAAVATSADGGATWSPIDSLRDADAMGWAFGPEDVWVSGHPGLSRSRDGGRTFVRAITGLPDTDVHAFGAGGPMLYEASPAVGVFASADGGATWEVRATATGQAFFGRILVDPTQPDHLVAADVRAGPVASSDGGRSWKRLGGVPGATWVSRSADKATLIASGPRGAARSTDGGRSWEPVVLPDGGSDPATGARPPGLGPRRPPLRHDPRRRLHRRSCPPTMDGYLRRPRLLALCSRSQPDLVCGVPPLPWRLFGCGRPHALAGPRLTASGGTALSEVIPAIDVVGTGVTRCPIVTNSELVPWAMSAHAF